MAASTNTHEENVAFLKRLEHLATQIHDLLIAKGEVRDEAENHVWSRPDLDIEYWLFGYSCGNRSTIIPAKQTQAIEQG